MCDDWIELNARDSIGIKHEQDESQQRKNEERNVAREGGESNESAARPE